MFGTQFLQFFLLDLTFPELKFSILVIFCKIWGESWGFNLGKFCLLAIFLIISYISRTEIFDFWWFLQNMRLILRIWFRENGLIIFDMKISFRRPKAFLTTNSGRILNHFTPTYFKINFWKSDFSWFFRWFSLRIYIGFWGEKSRKNQISKSWF